MHAGIIQRAWEGGKRRIRQFPGWVVFGLPMILALALKWALLQRDAFPFNADEAVVALMARHILGGERPIFFYGQAYMGSLDAFLVALGFAAMGEKVQVIRWVQTLLYLGMIATTIALARHLFRSPKVALLAGLILALPPVNVTLYTTVSLGGYGEALLIGNLLLLVAFKAWDRPEKPLWFAAWGFLAGLGYWALALTLLYSLPSGLLVLASLRRVGRRNQRLQALFVLGSGLILGGVPILIWALRYGFEPILREALGSAIAVGGPRPFGQILGERLLNLVAFGLPAAMGLRPPWDVYVFIPVLAALPLLFWIAAFLEGIHRLRTQPTLRPKLITLLAVPTLLIMGFLATPFGGDPSGRYFLPLVLPLALLGGAFTGAHRRWMGSSLRLSLFMGVLAFQILAHCQVVRHVPPGFTTQFDATTRIDHRYDDDLIAFLESQDELMGYSNYWVAYPLAFHSQEMLIYVPQLPYHLDLRYTERYDRYPPYGEAVAASPRRAYITVRHPALDAFLRKAFLERGIDWHEIQIGDYHVFYGLTQPLSPQDLEAPWLKPQ